MPLPNNSKAPKSYRLKATSWLEVRPYETPGLSETERTNMARSAKLALRALKIPESDPAWSYVQYRNPNGDVSSGLAAKRSADRIGSFEAGQGSEPPKRGLMSTSTKKVTKTKDTGDPKPPTSRPASSNTRDDEPAKSQVSKPPATRRPGSGFKAKQPTPTESREFANDRSPVVNGKAVLGEPSNITSGTRRSQNSSSSQASDKKTSSKKIEELRRDEVAASDSERPERMRDRDRDLKAQEDRVRDKKARESRERDRGKREKGAEREDRERLEEERERNKRDRGIERDREKDRERDRMDLERQRNRERAKRREAELESDRELEKSNKKVRDREWSQGREEGEHSDDGHRLSKRKISDDGYESSSRSGTKKRKMESYPPRSMKPRDLSLPKKPEVDLPPSRPRVTKKESPSLPLPKVIKKESSPPPLPKIPKESMLPKIKKGPVTKTSIPPAKTSSVSSNQMPNKSKSKRRRPEDIYTSSEDEGEIKCEPVPVSIPTLIDNHRGERSFQHRSQAVKPIVTRDCAALGVQFDDSYLPYLSNFQRLLKQKSRMRNILKKMDQDNVDSITESDGDSEVLEPEELKKLVMEYQNQHEDLEKMQQILQDEQTV